MLSEDVATKTRRICWPTFNKHCLLDECPYCQDHDHQTFRDIRRSASRRGIATVGFLDPLLTSQAEAWWNDATFSEAGMTEIENLHAKLRTVTAERDELRATLREMERLVRGERPTREPRHGRSRPAHARTRAHARNE